MEEKYDPEKIHLFTYGNFLLQAKYKDHKAYEYEIFIEIKESKNECYLVRAENQRIGFLWKGFCNGNSWTEIRDKLYLSENKDKLGKVYVRFGNKIIKEYQDYEEFWEKIKREK
jgi:hypothetical protein